MGYIERSVVPTEKLLYKARFHWLYYATAWTALFFLIVSIASVFIYTGDSVKIILLVVCAIGFLILLRRMLPIWTTEIGVTNHRLIVKRGWFILSTEELQLTAIEKVNFGQRAFGRLFGFGGVDVHGTGMEDLHVPAVADPVSFIKAIEEVTTPGKAIASMV